MRIGLVARQDCGGLAAQSLEFAKNLPITATMVVDLGELGRGPSFGYDWPMPIHVKGPWIDDLVSVRNFLNEVDVVLSIETFYGEMITELAKYRGIPTVRYANPELFKQEGESHVVLPTNWELNRMLQYGATVIPQGVTMPERTMDFVRHHEARTIMHFAAPAMMDRNGTLDFHAAMSHTRKGFTVKVAGPRDKIYVQGPQHDWHYDSEFRQNRLDFYTPDVDLLVLPRRYGGLCLPMLEAASYGIPTIAPDLSPQNEWFKEGLVPTEGYDSIPMVNGSFRVHKTDIMQLTNTIDRYGSVSIKELSEHALTWAKSNSWEEVTPIWIDYFSKILA